MMLPAWLSLLLLNMPGLYDEALIMGTFVYWLGPQVRRMSVRMCTGGIGIAHLQCIDV